MSLSRRAFLAAMPLALTACVSDGLGTVPGTEATPPIPPYYRSMYAAVEGEPFPVPAAELSKIDPRFWRQEVAYESYEPFGTIIVDTQARHLYYQLENGRALRYGIGVGRAGLEFEGTGVVQYKRDWPRWTPTPGMIAREPERYGHLSGGMEPGPTNPLGPRALYLFQNGVDTLYRIHGTTEDWSIGRAMSSGCIRLLNADIIDLHRRVQNRTKVVVLQGPQPEIVAQAL